MLFISCYSTPWVFHEPLPGLSLRTLTHFIPSVRNPILSFNFSNFSLLSMVICCFIVVVLLRLRVLSFERSFFTLSCFLPYTPCWCCFFSASSSYVVVVVLLPQQVLRIWEIFVNPRMFSTNTPSRCWVNLHLSKIDNREKDILILGARLTDRLDDTTIKSETKYFFNCLSLHCNAANSFCMLMV